MQAVSLVLVWSREQPRRVGERVFVPTQRCTLGREADRADQLQLMRPRGGQRLPVGPLASPRLSRRQLAVRSEGDWVHVERVGQRRLRIDGEEVDAGVARPGSCIEIDSEAMFFVEGFWDEVPCGLTDLPWGSPDPDGLVGESAAAWRHRRDLDQAPSGHLWIVGDRGSGRLRAARGVHRRRGAGRLQVHDADRITSGSTIIVPAALATPFLARSDIRCLVIADPETVPPRVEQRLDVPSLDARRADIPLVARQILLEWTLTEAKALSRHIDERGEPKLSIELVRQLMGADYPQNERTLSDVLWESVETSPQSRLAPPSEARNVRTAEWEIEFFDDD